MGLYGCCNLRPGIISLELTHQLPSPSTSESTLCTERKGHKFYGLEWLFLILIIISKIRAIIPLSWYSSSNQKGVVESAQINDSTTQNLIGVNSFLSYVLFLALPGYFCLFSSTWTCKSRIISLLLLACVQTKCLPLPSKELPLRRSPGFWLCFCTAPRLPWWAGCNFRFMQMKAEASPGHRNSVIIPGNVLFAEVSGSG